MKNSVIEDLSKKIEGKDKVIVFPEGHDIRVLSAAVRHYNEGLIKPVVLGNLDHVKNLAKDSNLDLEEMVIIDPSNYEKEDEMVAELVKIRKGKATEEQARELIKQPNYFGTMMVQMGMADGMVSGAIHSTGDTVRPALQIIKTKPGVSRTSGAMVMLGKEGERYLFADIAINIELTDQQVGEIAIVSAETAKTFGIDPKVAMLSFSTKGSASAPQQEKMASATVIANELAKEHGLNIPIDGELQFDAAIDPTVAILKAPKSKVAGKANVFIFPELQSGNIAYKVAQRLGGYEALGPILQGLNKPINDLSRGCSAEDVYKIGIITAAQSLD